MTNNELRVIAKEVITNHERLAVSSAQRYALKLAVAWIAEHPEDDETLVDVAWLVRCGFRIDDSGDFLWINNLKSGNAFDLQYWPSLNRWLMANFDSEVKVALSTRGDVRRLARALRVELGEGG